MAYTRMLFYYLTAASILFIFIGLWRPWVMLWWEDVATRRKVLKVYGVLAIAFFMIYKGLGFV